MAVAAFYGLFFEEILLAAAAFNGLIFGRDPAGGCCFLMSVFCEAPVVVTAQNVFSGQGRPGIQTGSRASG